MMGFGHLLDARPLVAAALIAFGFSTGAVAEDATALITGEDTDAIVAALASSGFEVKLTTDDDGDPMIESADKDEPFTVHFYRCDDDHRCLAIQLVSGWNLPNGITLAKIDAWNSKKVWGQAYRDENDDPWIGLAVNLKGGVSQENLEDTFEGWRRIMRDFEKHIGWKG